MKKDEILLNKNIIKLDSKLNIEKKRNLSYELNTITRQKTNRKLLGLFKTRLWLYNKTKQDSLKKFKKWIHNQVGEPPAIFRIEDIDETRESMHYYLNNKGYFNAKVTPKYDVKKKKATVVYHIDTKEIYGVDSVNYQIEDPVIRTLVLNDAEESYLKKGAPVDSKLFDREKNRISQSLRNQGFAYFYPNYVIYKSFDSTDLKVDVSTYVLNPTDTTRHQQYRIGDIYIYPGYYTAKSGITSFDTLSLPGGYHFLYKEKMSIKSKALLNAMFIEKGKLFKQNDFNDTKKRLSELGIYKFVTMRYFISKEDSTTLDFTIFLTPNKKQLLGYDIDLHTDNGAALGTGLNVNYRNRNFLKGAEAFTVNLNGGVEYGFGSSNNLFQTIDFGAQFNLYFPKWVVPFKLKNNPRRPAVSRLTLDYNFLDRRDYYRYDVFSTSFGYEWKQNKHIKHIMNPLSLDFFRILEIRSAFSSILNSNLYIQNSFTNQFILGSNYSFIYTGPVRKNGISFYYRGNFESAGNIANSFDRIIKPNQTFQPFDFDYSQYIRLDNDFRYYQKFNRRSSLAGRLFMGVGTAYNNSTEVPYVKQYFSGGTTSMRGWRLRGLGPGSFVDSVLINDPSTQPYQAGDFKLEANMEYRFDIFSVLEGAFFVDAGNIWTIKLDDRGPDAVLSSNFFKQIAIDAGVGMRLDFSYFIIRLDFAYKLRNPIPDENGNYSVYKKLSDFNPFDARLNLAIGYPF